MQRTTRCTHLNKQLHWKSVAQERVIQYSHEYMCVLCMAATATTIIIIIIAIHVRQTDQFANVTLLLRSMVRLY